MKYHHGNLKEELISSACIICEANGHDHMSLRSIAKEANVSQTAPYRHFKTKERWARPSAICLLSEYLFPTRKVFFCVEYVPL